MDWQITIEPVKGKSEKDSHDLPESRTFAIGTAQIVFGRETNCDVVFPPEARMVGGRHGRLFRQESGDYAIEAFGDHYFEVNGYRPEQGQPITGDSTIRFGNAKGPMVRVRMTRGARTDGLLSTLTQKEATPMSKVAAEIKVAVAALAVAVVVAVGVLWWMNYQAGVRFQQQMADMRTVLAEQVKNSFPSADALGKAAFAVILNDQIKGARVIGTAWPLQAGMLVTNAHIAALLDTMKSSEQLFVHRLDSQDNILVTGKRIHDGYKAFNDFVHGAILKSKGFAALTDGVAMPSAYDVAILEVDPSADLGDYLRPADNPAALAAGAPLAFAGYPIEGTGAQKLAQFRPNPQVQFGRVTALSDYFLFRADTPDALLVENSLPASGGASGSPIIDSSGKVVAILSGGTVDIHDGGRSPSAVMLNYAQRADLIGGVLNPSTFDAKAARAEWDKALALFDSHKNKLLAEATAALQKQAGGPVEVSDDPRLSLKTNEAVTVGPTSYREHQVAVAAGYTYTFIVYGEYSGTLNLMLMRDGNGIGAAFGSSWFSSLTYAADKDETLTLRVLGQASHKVDYELITLKAQSAAKAASAD